MTTLTLAQPVPRLTSIDRVLLRLAVSLAGLVEGRGARREAMRALRARRAEVTDAQRLASARFALGMPPR